MRARVRVIVIRVTTTKRRSRSRSEAIRFPDARQRSQLGGDDSGSLPPSALSDPKIYRDGEQRRAADRYRGRCRAAIKRTATFLPPASGTDAFIALRS